MTTKKRVRWSTITIHEFAVAHGGSAVPKSGPSIGLAPTPEFTWSTSVGTMASENDGVRRFTSAERMALLRDAGFTREHIDAFVDEAADVRKSRELYYSSEMKSFRKKRKKCKAEARAARRMEPEMPTATPTPRSPASNSDVTTASCDGANEGATAAATTTVADANDHLRIKIQLPPSAAKSSGVGGKLPASPSIVPAPIPLSPCCS